MLPIQKRGNSSNRVLVLSLICVAGLAMLLFMGLLFWLVTSFASQGKSQASAHQKPSRAASAVAEPGVSHFNERISRVPWSIHVVKVDRYRKDLSFFAPVATGKILGVSRISDQADSVPADIGRAIAGVNGDFYERDNRTYAGDPRGLQIANGELVSATSTVCVWFDADGNPHLDDVKGDFEITWPDGRKTSFGLNQERRADMAVLFTPTYGVSTRAKGGRDLILERDGDGPWLPLQAGQSYRAKVREIKPAADTPIPADAMVLSLGSQLPSGISKIAPGAVLGISTATTPDMKGVKTAIGGGPALIQHGEPFSQKAPLPGDPGGYSERSKYERHPRSAVGWNAKQIFLITVDGRQPGLSVGMTLAELAGYMVKQGCTEGMNFDGGVSASMWMSGEIMNDPCQGERQVANSLLVVRKPEVP